MGIVLFTTIAVVEHVTYAERSWSGCATECNFLLATPAAYGVGWQAKQDSKLLFWDCAGL